jgi:hypothetical protein
MSIIKLLVNKNPTTTAEHIPDEAVMNEILGMTKTIFESGKANVIIDYSQGDEWGYIFELRRKNLRVHFSKTDYPDKKVYEIQGISKENGQDIWFSILDTTNGPKISDRDATHNETLQPPKLKSIPATLTNIHKALSSHARLQKIELPTNIDINEYINQNKPPITSIIPPMKWIK